VVAAGSLLLDIGNSRVKWGIARDDQIMTGQPFPSRPDGLDAVLDSLWGGWPSPPCVWIACVARPQMAMAVEAWVGRHWRQCPVHQAQTKATACGVINAYQEPHKLGVDRWLSLIAVRQSGTQSACVAGCGTALTVDLLDSEGQHLGGVISPGLKLMHEALTQGADKLKNIEVSMDSARVADGWATTTAEGMAQGCLQASLGLIERIYSRYRASHPEPCRLILTGGDAPLLARHLAVPCEVQPDLVLKGLHVGQCADTGTAAPPPPCGP